MLFSVLAAVMLVALNSVLEAGQWRLIAAFSLASAVVALFSAQNTVLVAELLPTTVRATGLGIWLNLCAAAFGGTAPFVLQALSTIGRDWWYFYYAAAVCLAGTIPAWLVRDMRGRELD